jgi:hypothetical protein
MSGRGGALRRNSSRARPLSVAAGAVEPKQLTFLDNDDLLLLLLLLLQTRGPHRPRPDRAAPFAAALRSPDGRDASSRRPRRETLRNEVESFHCVQPSRLRPRTIMVEQALAGFARADRRTGGLKRTLREITL